MILREINFWDSRIAECHFSTFRGSEFLFYEFLHFLKAEIYQMTKIQSPKNGKNGSIRPFRYIKLDFT